MLSACWARVCHVSTGSVRTLWASGDRVGVPILSSADASDIAGATIPSVASVTAAL